MRINNKKPSFVLTARRGLQNNRKDKDLMRDTGGESKRKRNKEPDFKPSRTDVKKKNREKTLRKDEKDKDIHGKNKK